MWHQKAKGPPDGPPIFLIFVEKLNCPQSQAYQSISPVGTGLSLTDRALGVSLGTSIGNYSPLIAPQPVKLKIRCQRWRVGSSPTTGTKLNLRAMICGFSFFMANRHHYSKFGGSWPAHPGKKKVSGPRNRQLPLVSLPWKAKLLALNPII